MSYYQKILKDSPLGFWAMESGYITKDISSGYWSGNTRTRNTATNTVNYVNYHYVPPLVSAGINAIKFIPGGGKFDIPNVYNIFYRGTEQKTFTIEFWLAFDL
jgi:hypothetical protein